MLQLMYLAPFLLLYHTVNPCQNGGTCTEAEDGVTYSCQCPDWFEGFKCEKRFEKGKISVMLIFGYSHLNATYNKKYKIKWCL